MEQKFENKMNTGIELKDRRAIADGLNRVLADSFSLYLKTHGFHWNVTGPQFHTLHELFMTQYTELWTALDEIAERVRALGFPTAASYSQYQKLTSIEEESGVPNAQEMIRQLVTGNESVARVMREVVPVADNAEDSVTADLLTRRMEVHEKNAWMLRSMLEA